MPNVTILGYDFYIDDWDNKRIVVTLYSDGVKAINKDYTHTNVNGFPSTQSKRLQFVPKSARLTSKYRTDEHD